MRSVMTCWTQHGKCRPWRICHRWGTDESKQRQPHQQQHINSHKHSDDRMPQ
jgi:hypothetical protein